MEDKIVNIEDDIEINVGVSDSTHVTVDQRIKNVIADVDKVETDIGFSEATGHVSVDSRITSITTDITNIQSDIGYDTATSQYTGLNTRVTDLDTKVATIETDINIAYLDPSLTPPAHVSVDDRIKSLVTDVTAIETDIDIDAIDNTLSPAAHVSVASRLTSLETFESTVSTGFTSISDTLNNNDDLTNLNSLLDTLGRLSSDLPEARNIADVSTMFAVGSRANNMKEMKDRLDVLENHDALMSNAMIRLVERSSCTLNKVDELADLTLRTTTKRPNTYYFNVDECNDQIFF